MSYLQRTVSHYGNELGFIKAFIGALTAADSRITCLTTDAELDEQFRDGDAKPAFSFDLGGCDTITFTRDARTIGTTSSYVVSSTLLGANITTVYFSGDYVDANSNANRTFRFRVAGDSNVLVVDFGGYNTSVNAQIACMTGSTKAAAYSNAAPYTAISSTFKLVSDGTTMSRVNRLPYVYNPSNLGQLEIIDGKIFAAGGNRMLTVSTIKDTSTVTTNTVVTIDNKNYLALDANTLMEV